ncbi:hypothetical protein C723_0261 [Christiangramia flava JLT2011]|uniref:Uncharacterized protein n=1 Tax=Christiangramia flava JLT2011 TaxID=1229726 RepID=A0A1L7I424_9FLAO|nr:hypothetical protein GRFL_1636 [Christiangramia flava JLT2011]OSS40852.1 hypothetical protein C723_0261 [Christiangramia flava JLT2011]
MAIKKQHKIIQRKRNTILFWSKLQVLSKDFLKRLLGISAENRQSLD